MEPTEAVTSADVRALTKAVTDLTAALGDAAAALRETDARPSLEALDRTLKHAHLGGKGTVG